MTFTILNIELIREARNAAYRAGLCVQCGTNPHSPGRRRCERCQHVWRTLPGTQAIAADVLYASQLCTGPICTRDGKSFRVRRDSGLCEMCTQRGPGSRREGIQE